ncbi:hypothetical protein ACSXEK_16380 (plasmid) [Clostridium perfringens]
MDKNIIIDWKKFKSNVKSNMLKSARNGFIEFYEMLDKTDFELSSDYVKAIEKVELIYKLDNNIKLNIKPNNFKTQTYKRIIDFKNKLTENGDEFIRFVNISDKGTLISQIKTFDRGVVDIDVGAYSKWNRGRQEFYNKLKEIGGYTSDYYRETGVKINISLDGAKLNPISPSNFKKHTYKSIINFKELLKKNNDKFIKFVGLTDGGNLIAKIKTFDGGEINLDIASYNQRNNSRKDFYNKLKEVNGYTSDFYKDNKAKMDIYIDDVKLNINVNHFKALTHGVITNFKNNLIKNGDVFIKFTGLTNDGNLIARFKTIDDAEVEIDIAAYSKFITGRQSTYDYCEEKGYKILNPYISTRDKILVDFNCGHDPHWIKPPVLKSGVGCPICNQSKGEKSIRQYLEKNNIEFKQEYRFNDCRHKLPLPFDFYIENYNLCIEFDGGQHFKKVKHFGEESFKLTQIRDKIKNKFCEENNIRLIRIPYWELDNIENILGEEFDRLRK